MAQHDYVIANGTGAAVRSDLNNALAAIVTQNSGATAPATTYAYQWWADTTTGLLKIRNAANNAWVTIGSLSTAGFGLLAAGDTLTAALGSASTPGITFTGDLNTGIYSPGADQVAISTNGTGRITIDGSGNVNIDSNTLYVDATNNRVGIGTTSPARLLHVASSAADGAIVIDGGSSNAAFLDFRIAGTNKHYIGSANLLGSGTNSDMTVWNSANGYLNFGTNGTERFRCDSSGRLLVGTSTATANGGVLQVSNGITFPATQSACSDANTLDDYEEGTCLFYLIGTTGSAGSYSASFNSGRYIKIGRFVWVTGYVGLSNKGSYTGNAIITGLPFTVNNESASYSFASCYYANVTLAANSYGVNGYPIVGTTTVQLTKNQATSASELTMAEIGNNTQIGAFAFGYYTSA